MSTHFEDKDATCLGAGGYEVTNEEPECHRDLLRGLPRCKVGGGIAGGGDIPLFNLLPRCEKVIVADHAYQSLTAFMLKVLLLRELKTPQAVRALLEDPKAFPIVVAGLEKDLPERLRAYITDNGNYYTGLKAQIVSLRREWRYVTNLQIARAMKNLDRLVVLHADLMALREYGPFNLLYTSNAHEHLRKDGSKLKPDEVAALLAPGGYLFYTHNHSFTSTLPPAVWPNLPLKEVKAITGYRTQWNHVLTRKEA